MRSSKTTTERRETRPRGHSKADRGNILRGGDPAVLEGKGNGSIGRQEGGRRKGGSLVGSPGRVVQEEKIDARSSRIRRWADRQPKK